MVVVVVLIYSVYYLVGEFAWHLQRQAQVDFPSKSRTLFTDEEVVSAQIAGLCHDLGEQKFPQFFSLGWQLRRKPFNVGHGPFSHLFEHYVMQLKVCHIISRHPMTYNNYTVVHR